MIALTPERQEKAANWWFQPIATDHFEDGASINAERAFPELNRKTNFHLPQGKTVRTAGTTSIT
jgi:hypothetical protein